MALPPNDLSWKERYEKSESGLASLKNLAHKAVADYEDLLRKYDQNQKQYEELKQRLVETEKQLSDLQNVLEPVYDEYSNLDHRYKLEKACRNEAENYATKVHQQNRQLKRQSQLMVQSLSIMNVDITKMVESGDDINDNSADHDQMEHLNAIIEDLQSQVVKLQHEVKKTREDRDEAVQAQKHAEKQWEAEVQTTTWLRQALEHHEGQLRQFKRVSVKACTEYDDLIDRFSAERKLKEEAEKYASHMLSERDAMARESSVLIGSAMSHERLRNALLEIEDLNKKLQMERNEHMQKTRDLQEELSQSKDLKQMSDLENQIQGANEQIGMLQKQVRDVNSWNEKLNKRNQELENRIDVASQKLDIAEQKLKPPPPPAPPPLPPEGFFKPLKILLKKRKQVETAAAGKKGSERDDKYGDALQEMMKRIKSGSNMLRPAAQRRPSLPDDSNTNNGSAMDDLHQLLRNSKTRSRSLPHIHESTTDENDFMKTFARIKGNSDSPVRNLSLIEEVEERESVSLEDRQYKSEAQKERANEVFV